MDFRLVDQTREWMKEQGLMGDCDDVSLAGASKELVDGEKGAKELLLKQIKIACDLHEVSQVILVHHSDCGAYKASYNFSSLGEEEAKQIEDLKKSEEIIRKEFPKVEVMKVWAQMKDDNGNKVEFRKI